MTEPPHTLDAPPSDSELNQKIAEILATAASVYLAAQLIEKLLRPWRIGVDAILMSLRLVGRGSAHKPRPMFAAQGIDRKAPSADIVRRVSNEDLFFRAAYVVASSKRMQLDLDSGKSQPITLADESINYRKHEFARTRRARAGQLVAIAAQVYGDLLGWYLNPLLNNEIECITASGNNFRTDEPPIIGWPGLVHVGCGCKAGQPHVEGRMVNDVLESMIERGHLRLRRREAS